MYRPSLVSLSPVESGLGQSSLGWAEPVCDLVPACSLQEGMGALIGAGRGPGLLHDPLLRADGDRPHDALGLGQR